MLEISCINCRAFLCSLFKMSEVFSNIETTRWFVSLFHLCGDLPPLVRFCFLPPPPRGFFSPWDFCPQFLTILRVSFPRDTSSPLRLQPIGATTSTGEGGGWDNDQRQLTPSFCWTSCSPQGSERICICLYTHTRVHVFLCKHANTHTFFKQSPSNSS